MNAIPLFPQLHDSHVDARFDARANNTLWIHIPAATDGRPPYFSPPVLEGLSGLLHSLRTRGVTWPAGGAMQPVNYTVMRSDHPEYFSLGGDLEHFHDCITRRDRDALRDYSMRCADMLYDWSTLLSEQTTTIALVQGRALGGGFETALAADVIIAEEQAEFGFPEILFGLFPCTGGMSLLAQRIGARAAERMLADSRIYSAAELKQRGIVDEVCGRGEGEATVQRYIANHARQRMARLMLQRSRHRHASLDHEELRRIVEEWTETAMQLGRQELRVMEMLVKMQRSRPAA